jgi:hypothetical protein
MQLKELFYDGRWSEKDCEMLSKIARVGMLEKVYSSKLISLKSKMSLSNRHVAV